MDNTLPATFHFYILERSWRSLKIRLNVGVNNSLLRSFNVKKSTNNVTQTILLK